jgi:hypothetical protein
MDKHAKLPHEGVAPDTDDGIDDLHRSDDGGQTDTEGHRYKAADSLSLPGTGGDFSPRTPSSGGELIDIDDVEGHSR